MSSLSSSTIAASRQAQKAACIAIRIRCGARLDAEDVKLIVDNPDLPCKTGEPGGPLQPLVREGSFQHILKCSVNQAFIIETGEPCHVQADGVANMKFQGYRASTHERIGSRWFVHRPMDCSQMDSTRALADKRSERNGQPHSYKNKDEIGFRAFISEEVWPKGTPDLGQTSDYLPISLPRHPQTGASGIFMRKRRARRFLQTIIGCDRKKRNQPESPVTAGLGLSSDPERTITKRLRSVIGRPSFIRHELELRSIFLPEFLESTGNFSGGGSSTTASEGSTPVTPRPTLVTPTFRSVIIESGEPDGAGCE